MELTDTIFVAGASGMVGSAIVRKLVLNGYSNLLTDRIDLRNQGSVNQYFDQYNPKYIFLVAGKVGGIKANNEKKAEFIYDNVMIASNVIEAAHKNGVTKLLYSASSCVFPKNCPQPMKEDYLLSGELEKTNEPYAVAKIAGIKLCQSYNHQYGSNFISCMPTNSYGEGDNYDLYNSHVVPALIRKIITAKNNGEKNVEIWGTGNARREFLYVDDMAEAMLFLMKNYDLPEIINIGTGEEFTIRQLANNIAYIVKYQGDFLFNGQLDGTFRKLLCSEKINKLGWKAKIELDEGLRKTISTLKQDWYNG